MSPISKSIAENVRHVTGQLQAAASAADRRFEDITLIAVSKRHSVAAVREAYAQGLRHFGENYWQEAQVKIEATADLDITWHFIGPIQSNKTRGIANACDWVHTVDRARIAARLSDQREHTEPLNVCLQVNVDADPNKSGVEPAALADLVRCVRELPGLRLRGIMTIPSTESEPASAFARLASLFRDCANIAGAHWDTLSMGMSSDFASAIAAGATHVRIGTAIFGPRDPA